MPLFQLVVSTGLSQTVPVETPLTAKASTPSMRWGRLRWRQGVGEVRLAPPSPPRLPPCWPPRMGKIWCPLYCLAAALGGRAVVELRSLCELYNCRYLGHFQIWSHSHIVHTWKLSPQQLIVIFFSFFHRNSVLRLPSSWSKFFVQKLFSPLQNIKTCLTQKQVLRDEIIWKLLIINIRSCVLCTIQLFQKPFSYDTKIWNMIFYLLQNSHL